MYISFYKREKHRCPDKEENRRKIRNKAFVTRKKLLLLETIIPLMVAGVIYYFFCPDVYFVKMLDRIFAIGERHKVISNDAVVLFLRNFGLDFVWAFSFSVLISFFVEKRKWLRVVIPFSMGLLIEILQKYHVISGTFDYFDILAEALGIALAYIICLLQEVLINEKKE